MVKSSSYRALKTSSDSAKSWLYDLSSYARKDSICNMYSMNVVLEFQSGSAEIQQTFLQQQMNFLKYLLYYLR